MKPAPFIRHVPRTVAEAVRILAEVAGQDGRVLAGGQSLVPIMAFRLAKPAHLVDINEIEELGRIASDGKTLRVGALVRHAAFHKPVVEGPLGAILSHVARHIAHYPIRTRGTFCGSLAHADPASEWCLVAATLDATMVAKSTRGERLIAAKRLFRRHHERRRWPRTSCSSKCGCRFHRTIPNSDSTNSTAAPAISQ